MEKLNQLLNRMDDLLANMAEVGKRFATLSPPPPQNVLDGYFDLQKRMVEGHKAVVDETVRWAKSFDINVEPESE